MGLDIKTDWLTDRQSQCDFDFDLPGLLIALMMEAARTSETLVNFYQTTRCYNPEDSNLHTRRRENLKSYIVHTASQDHCVEAVNGRFLRTVHQGVL
jgi:hypothetical protein